MATKDTQQLQNELTSAPDLSTFLSGNEEHFCSAEFSELLHELFKKSKLSKATLAKRAGTSDVYLYQIFSGDRKPSRDRALCLCVGLSASLEETQTLLKHSGLPQLYAKDRRDAIVIYGITRKLKLMDINEMLFDENEDPLC